MKRPSDQAKVLFLALLRGTVSAIATESKAGMGNMARNNLPPFPPMSTIRLRLAKQADVASIQRCNLATLPENYNSQFYCNHLRQWPDLALVAEHVTEDQDRGGEGSSSTSAPFGRSFPLKSKPQPNVVAYVLGKVEVQQPPPSTLSAPFYLDNRTPNASRNDVDRMRGHVTSLAVLQPYRRQGLANELMKQLHFHLEQCYGVSSVGLHVRKSNFAAHGLYKDFGYQIADAIPNYYQDGEDAYFMKKVLPRSQSMKTNNNSRIGGFFGRRSTSPWKGANEYYLPRDLGLRNNKTDDNPATDEEEATPELLSGSI